MSSVKVARKVFSHRFASYYAAVQRREDPYECMLREINSEIPAENIISMQEREWESEFVYDNDDHFKQYGYWNCTRQIIVYYRAENE